MSHLAAQDEADGRALRLLREALPEGWMLAVYQYAVPSPPWQAVVWPPDAVSPVRGSGDTIAEAADACRAALGR